MNIEIIPIIGNKINCSNYVEKVTAIDINIRFRSGFV